MPGIMPFILSAILAASARGCVLNGYDSGTCIAATTFPAEATFCKEFLTDRVCTGKPLQYFTYLSIVEKDQLLKQIYLKSISQRLLSEADYTTSQKALTQNRNCARFYRRFLCTWNFPSCNETHESEPLCSRICTDFERHCGYSYDICNTIYKNLVS